jgi:hypothetical protein
LACAPRSWAPNCCSGVRRRACAPCGRGGSSTPLIAAAAALGGIQGQLPVNIAALLTSISTLIRNPYFVLLGDRLLPRRAKAVLAQRIDRKGVGPRIVPRRRAVTAGRTRAATPLNSRMPQGARGHVGGSDRIRTCDQVPGGKVRAKRRIGLCLVKRRPMPHTIPR